MNFCRFARFSKNFFNYRERRLREENGGCLLEHVRSHYLR